jgi:hypothetical protein
MQNSETFRSRRGQPEDLLLRQTYLTQSAFPSRPVGPTILRLLNEPDPIALINPESRRLMTEADIDALADLTAFAQSAGSPCIVAREQG